MSASVHPPRDEDGASDLSPGGEVLAKPGERVPLDAVGLASFFGSLAHDLRSPLGAINEALSELGAAFGAQFTDDHRLLSTLANRGIQRLGRISDAVSLAAALSSATFALRRQPTDLTSLLERALATAKALEPRREVQLTSALPPGPCPIVADEARLTQAFVELAINAVRYARRAAEVRVVWGDGEVQIAFEDDGQGVAVERRATLFQRFAQRPSRTGLGMGLANANEVIVAHGGTLRLEASGLPPGRAGTVGARLVVTLPIGQVDPGETV